MGAGEVTGVAAFEAWFFFSSLSSSAMTRARSADAFAAAALNEFVSSALARSAAVGRSGRSARSPRSALGGGDAGGVGAVSTAWLSSSASAKASLRASSADPADPAAPLALLLLGLDALSAAARLDVLSFDLS